MVLLVKMVKRLRSGDKMLLMRRMQHHAAVMVIMRQIMMMTTVYLWCQLHRQLIDHIQHGEFFGVAIDCFGLESVQWH